MDNRQPNDPAAMPALLIAASVFILLALGSMHLWFAFRGNAALVANAA